MRRRINKPSMLILAIFLAACTLPGVAPPTPFTFPTPNPTLSTLFESIATDTPLVPTLPPLPPTATTEPSPTGIPVATDELPTIDTSAGSTRPNGSPVTAIHLTTPPTIDGDLSEWTLTYRINQNVYGYGAWNGIGDASADYSVAWDDVNLYLAILVTDDTFVQSSSGELIYRGDSIEIQLDANLAADFSEDSLDADDYQIGISPGDFSTILSQAYRWYPSALSGPISTAQIGAIKTAQGYELEVSIPWVIFGVIPSGGARFGFALSVSDNDTPGAASQQSMISSVSSRTLNDPTTWGTLVLE